MNRVNARAIALSYFGLRAWDNENMFVVLRSVLDVVNFFVNVPLHAAAERGIKLGEIADFQNTKPQAQHPEKLPRSNIQNSSRAFLGFW